MVGWGSAPYLTEYSKSGKVLLDASFPGPDITYRAYVLPWVGKPTTAPSGAGRTSGSKATIYASWNGATSVAKWRVLGGPSASRLKTVATKAKAGFETAISLTHGFRAYKVVALDSRGRVLGRSKTFGAKKGKAPSQPPVSGY
jgi:hypothetical protein